MIMARIHNVAHARKRYARERAEGEPTPVMRGDGTQKTTKRGKPIVRRQFTISGEPLPNHTCDRCGTEIRPLDKDTGYPGDPYKWIKPKSGPYGGRMRVRCGTCPAWHVWEYSSSTGAQIARIGYEYGLALPGAESADEVRDALSQAAEEIRELAQEKEEGADNIESGFGHATSTSDDLRQVASDLESWADEVEGADVPEYPEHDDDCEECQENEDEPCEGCISTWHDEVDALDALGNSPV
jgi:hypothetical protein